MCHILLHYSCCFKLKFCFCCALFFVLPYHFFCSRHFMCSKYDSIQYNTIQRCTQLLSARFKHFVDLLAILKGWTMCWTIVHYAQSLLTLHSKSFLLFAFGSFEINSCQTFLWMPAWRKMYLLTHRSTTKGLRKLCMELCSCSKPQPCCCCWVILANNKNPKKPLLVVTPHSHSPQQHAAPNWRNLVYWAGKEDHKLRWKLTLRWEAHF